MAPQKKSRAENVDILGDAYEYLMRYFASKSGKSKGRPLPASDMNRQMKRCLENTIFFGFSGTPPLKRGTNKLRTRDVFCTFIHTYKFHQAVADKEVLDLKYPSASFRGIQTSATRLSKHSSFSWL